MKEKIENLILRLSRPDEYLNFPSHTEMKEIFTFAHVREFAWDRDISVPYMLLESLVDYDYILANINGRMTPYCQIGPDSLDCIGYGEDLILSAWIALLKLKLKEYE